MIKVEKPLWNAVNLVRVLSFSRLGVANLKLNYYRHLVSPLALNINFIWNSQRKLLKSSEKLPRVTAQLATLCPTKVREALSFHTKFVETHSAFRKFISPEVKEQSLRRITATQRFMKCFLFPRFPSNTNTEVFSSKENFPNEFSPWLTATLPHHRRGELLIVFDGGVGGGVETTNTESLGK